MVSLKITEAVEYKLVYWVSEFDEAVSESTVQSVAVGFLDMQFKVFHL
jgi:hypothetical protein